MPPIQNQSNLIINSHNNNNNHQAVLYPTDSILSEPKLYVSELQFSITENELRDLFEDVIQPTSVQINRLQGNSLAGTPNTAVITFATIDHAEKAFAIYNNSKLDAYNIYLKLHINDPASGIYDMQTQTNALVLQAKQLSPTHTNLSLFDTFRPFGPLFSVRIQFQDNKFKGSAYVQYFRKEDADKAVTNMSSKDNKAMIVQYLRHNNNKTPNRSNSNNNKSMGVPITAPYTHPTNFNNSNSHHQNNQHQQHQQQHLNQQQLPQQPQQQPQGPTSPGPEGPIVDPCNLFIKNLDSNISSSDLFSQFRRFGKIISARVMRDQETGNSKGFGFVSYSSSEEADKAKQAMHGKTLGTKQIVVRLHEPKKLREAKLANQFSPNTGGSGIVSNNNNNNIINLGGGGGGGGGGGPISPSSPNNNINKNDNNNNNNENRVPSRRSSELFPINVVNEFGHDDLHSLAPKARKEVLMSELQKRFKNIPSVPHEEVNYIIDYLLNLKTPEVLHILKDATALQYRITEARQLISDKKRRGNEGTVIIPPQHFNSNNNSNSTNHVSNHLIHNNINASTTDLSSLGAQVSQRDKFHKAILKICPGNVDEILDLILTLSTKDRRLCYFNPEHLNKKIHEALQALEVVTNDDNLSSSPKSIAASTEITPVSTPPFIKSNESLNITPSYSMKPVNSITSTTTTSPTSGSTRNSEWEEIQQFMDSIKFKPTHERKQKLGDRLFRKVKSLGLKSAMASKVTINLLDTDDLYELAHSMNDNDKFREKVAAAERAVNSK